MLSITCQESCQVPTATAARFKSNPGIVGAVRPPLHFDSACKVFASSFSSDFPAPKFQGRFYLWVQSDLVYVR